MTPRAAHQIASELVRHATYGQIATKEEILQNLLLTAKHLERVRPADGESSDNPPHRR